MIVDKKIKNYLFIKRRQGQVVRFARWILEQRKEEDLDR
jgi:hypothetical protein